MEFAAQSLADGRLIVSAGTQLTETRYRNIFEKCDEVYWLVTPDDWKHALLLLRKVLDGTKSLREKLCIVWLLTLEGVAPLAPELRELMGEELKLTLSTPPKNVGTVLKNGFERLVHHIRGVKIGIALGGGAARGMAHLGVLKALERQGIVIDMIAGTSAGAMTGTVYAANLEVDYAINSFCADLRPSWLFRMIPEGDQWFLLYKYRTRQFDPMLRKYLLDHRLEQLPLPMHTITVDLISGNVIVRDQGDAVHAILESINLPLLSKPINRGGQALVDGGLIDNVPADVLVSKGCNFVIAVSVTAKLEAEFARNRLETPADQMRPASTIQTLLRSYLVQSHNINSIGVAPADFVIEPDLTGFRLTEFTRTDELAETGALATIESIQTIKQKLHRLDPQLFP
jgi:predicted acylesterase/phospholipase RssA